MWLGRGEERTPSRALMGQPSGKILLGRSFDVQNEFILVPSFKKGTKYKAIIIEEYPYSLVIKFCSMYY